MAAPTPPRISTSLTDTTPASAWSVAPARTAAPPPLAVQGTSSTPLRRASRCRNRAPRAYSRNVPKGVRDSRGNRKSLYLKFCQVLGAAPETSRRPCRGYLLIPVASGLALGMLASVPAKSATDFRGSASSASSKKRPAPGRRGPVQRSHPRQRRSLEAVMDLSAGWLR